MPASNFEVRREGLQFTTSGTLPSGSAIVIGKALRTTGKDPDTGINSFSLANGRADGFLVRDVQLGVGPSDTEIAFGTGRTDYDTGNPGTPYTAGTPGSIKMHDELEVEGAEYILGSSAAAISSSTAVDTLLSFNQGRFAVAQTGDWVQFRLVKQMTVVNGGASRIYVKKIGEYIA